MTSPVCPWPEPRVLPAGGMGPRAAFGLLVSITVGFLAGSSAPTPLYPVYQAMWGFSPVTVTVVFGIYALAVLGALLVAGRLSDHVGRRPVLLAATLAQAAAMAVFATAQGVGDLLVARGVQGLSAGAALAAVGAGLLDLDRTRGTTANAVAPMMGTALGGMVSGFMVHWLPAPTHLVYALLGGLFLLQAAGVLRMPETAAPRAGALASLQPRLRVPAAVRGPLLTATPVLLAAWALAGFYGALGPAVVHQLLGLEASLHGGLALFTLAASGGLGVLLLQRRGAGTMMTLGATALLAGVGLALAALPRQSVPLFFLGTAVAGVGFGAGFQGAVRTVVAAALPRERAAVLSVVFVLSYLAMGLPAVVAGALVVRGHAVLDTAFGFGSTVMVLAGLALLGTLARRGGPPPSA